MKRLLSFILCIVSLPQIGKGQSSFEYSISSDINFGTGDFAPTLYSSNKHGLISTESNSGVFSAGLLKRADNSLKFDYNFGVQLAGAYNNASNYWIQQLYAGVNYKKLNLSIGSRQWDGTMKNQQLSSGALVWSGNSRPIPEVRLGINQFITVPYTKGWLQVKGDISYGKFIDDNYLEGRFNYQESFLTTDVWFHQKKLFFRSKEEKPFIVTFGAEFAAQFGGNQQIWKNGELMFEQNNSTRLKNFFQVLIPRPGDSQSSSGDQAYFYGNHLGSWHGIAEYKTTNDWRFKGYFEWLFEDGSGMGKLNGWDGLWGVEITTQQKYVTGLVVEYLQTTNQSGPIHFAPNDFPDHIISGEATGSDDYYNNYFYNGWGHFGMNNGNPLLKPTRYNQDGHLRITDSRVKSYHLGVTGDLGYRTSYRVLTSLTNTWGTSYFPSTSIKKNYALLTEISHAYKGWSFKANFAIDRGDLYGNNTGGAIAVSKSGELFKKRTK